MRYDFEANTRKEGLSENERLDQLKLNKISGLRYKEETGRGFDILNNAKLEGSATTIKMDQVSSSGPVKIWNQVLHNANTNEEIQEQIKKFEEEEYYQKLKERGVNADFKKTELDKLGSYAN